MKRVWTIIAAAVLVLGVVGTAQAAGDVDAGKAKAKKCAACHGADGMGKGSNPPIAGKDAVEFIVMLNDYKSGAKKNKMMKMSTKKLSDADIENLAAYFGSLK